MKPFVTAIALIISLSTIAQNPDTNSATDLTDTEVPGSLVVDFGINFLGNDSSDSLDFGIYGSRIFRVGYQYEQALGKSAFSFNPGIHFSVEKYKFKEDITLRQNMDGTIGLDTLFLDVIKSQISTTYLEVPLELRWHQSKTDKQRGFKIAAGFKVGLRTGSKTKYKYEQSGDKQIVKDKQSYQIRRWRYGVYGKVGMGSISMYYYQSLTELFENNKGPGATSGTPFQIGLTYEIF